MAENVLDFDKAEDLQLKALKIRHELDDEWGIALSKNVLAILARHQGRTRDALSLFEESLSIRRKIGNKLGLGETLFYLGDLLTAVGRLDEATERLNEAIEVIYEIRNKLGIANTLECCSRLALAKDDPERSAALMFAAQRLRDEIGATLTPSEEKVLNEHLLALKDQMKPVSFSKAKKRGLSLSFEEARELASAV